MIAFPSLRGADSDEALGSDRSSGEACLTSRLSSRRVAAALFVEAKDFKDFFCDIGVVVGS